MRPSPREMLTHPFFTQPTDGIPVNVIPFSLPKTIMSCPLNNEFLWKLQKTAANQTIATDEQNSFQVDYNPLSMPKKVNTILFNEVTSGFLRVNLWLAWNNYGIGYLMSNNSIGAIFFDKTTLFYSPCYTKILYSKPADPDAMTSSMTDTSNYSPILPQKRAQ